MSIRPVDFNGMVQRTQDVGTVKQNQDNKPAFDQQNLAGKIQKDTEQNLRQVNQSEDAERHQKKFDAKEKGDNEYQEDSKRKKKQEKKTEGKVINKSAYSSFDIKI